MGEESEVAENKHYKKIVKYFSTELEEPLFSIVKQALEFGNLTSLVIHGSKVDYRLNDMDVKVLAAGIHTSAIPLQHFALKFHNITDAGAIDIGSIVVNPDIPLLYLDVEGNDITSPASLGLRDPECKLMYLNLSSNPLGEYGGMELSSYICNNSILQQLHIDRCNFNLKASVAIITSLHENSHLQVLAIDRPLLNTSKQEEVTDHISRVLLDKHSKLNELSLRFHGLFDKGARLLSDAISRNLVLTSINLESNNISINGAEAIASFLILQQRQKIKDPHSQRNYVERIKLSHNLICDEGAIAIAEAIRVNTSLKEVTLRSNRIGKDGLVALAESLAVTNTLESLTVFGNDFEQVSGRMFHDLLANRLSYLGMKLDVEVYIVDGVYMIADTMR